MPPPIILHNSQIKFNEVVNQNQEEVQQIPEYIPRKEKTCIHHERKLALYCESCEEVICEQCSVLGPHNNQVIITN